MRMPSNIYHLLSSCRSYILISRQTLSSVIKLLSSLPLLLEVQTVIVFAMNKTEQ